MFYDRLERICKQKKTSVFATCQALGITASTSSSWKKNGNTPNGDVCSKIADLLGVPVDYLLKDEPTSIDVSDENIKVALSGEIEDVTDEMYEEVKQFAKFVKEKYKNKNDNNK